MLIEPVQSRLGVDGAERGRTAVDDAALGGRRGLSDEEKDGDGDEAAHRGIVRMFDRKSVTQT